MKSCEEGEAEDCMMWWPAAEAAQGEMLTDGEVASEETAGEHEDDSNLD